MKLDDPALQGFLRQAMVARIATCSGSGRPSVTPLYFDLVEGRIWLGTSAWTLAARHVRADPRVSLLFELERRPRDGRLLRIRGRARVLTNPRTQRAYVLRALLKYSLSPGGLRNHLANLGKLGLMNRYHDQSSERGQPCVIEVAPEHVELLSRIAPAHP